MTWKSRKTEGKYPLYQRLIKNKEMAKNAINVSYFDSSL